MGIFLWILGCFIILVNGPDYAIAAVLPILGALFFGIGGLFAGLAIGMLLFPKKTRV